MVTREFKVTYMTSICGSHRISTGQCQTRHRAPHGLQRLMAALTALSCWSSNLWRIHSSLRKRMNGKKPFFCCIVETELANLGVFISNPWVQRLQMSISGKTSNLSKNTLYSLGGIFFFFFFNNHNMAREREDWYSCVWYKVILKAVPEEEPQKHSELGQHHWNKWVASQFAHVKVAVNRCTSTRESQAVKKAKYLVIRP